MEETDIIICKKKKETKAERISKMSIIINNDSIVFQLLTNYSLSDSLSDEVNSKSSLIRFSTFLFLTSYLHSSKSI